MDFANAALITSILAGMIIIPISGQEVTGDFTGDFDAAGSDLLETPQNNTEELPRKISESIGSDSYVREFQTAVGRAIFEISPEKAVKKLIQPDVTVEVSKTTENSVWNLESQSCSLKITRDAVEETSLCKTPDGTLRVTTSSGKSQEFDGINRERVQERCKECRESLRLALEKLDRIEKDLSLNKRDLEITGIHTGSEDVEDYINITNMGETSVSLEGLGLEETTEEEGNCPLSGSLESGETKRRFISQNCGISILAEDDKVLLKNSEGKVISSYE